MNVRTWQRSSRQLREVPWNLKTLAFYGVLGCISAMPACLRLYGCKSNDWATAQANSRLLSPLFQAVISQPAFYYCRLDINTPPTYVRPHGSRFRLAKPYQSVDYNSDDIGPAPRVLWVASERICLPIRYRKKLDLLILASFVLCNALVLCAKTNGCGHRQPVFAPTGPAIIGRLVSKSLWSELDHSWVIQRKMFKILYVSETFSECSRRLKMWKQISCYSTETRI